PEQTCPSWRESIGLIVGGLRTQARRAVSEGPRAVWWDGMRLAAALLVSASMGRSLYGFLFLPSMRPHLLPLLLGLTVVALMRRPTRLGLALVAADVLAEWPAPLPLHMSDGAGILAFSTPSYAPFLMNGAWSSYLIIPLLPLALATAVFAWAPRVRRSHHAWTWWFVAPAILFPAASWLLPTQIPALSYYLDTDLLVLVIPALVLGGLSVITGDPRPGIGAAAYVAADLLIALIFDIQYGLGAYPFMLPSLLTAICIAALVMSSRSRAYT
ncbi:MAG: hypothetical protein ACRDPA_02750, partial [Solirubrobacteraceae bacterium]